MSLEATNLKAQKEMKRNPIVSAFCPLILNCVKIHQLCCEPCSAIQQTANDTVVASIKHHQSFNISCHNYVDMH